MSRQIINRLLLVIFAVVIFAMGVVYVKQEHKMEELRLEQLLLVEKQKKVEYVINEYIILIESVDSRNFIIRLARERLGWVFDNETVYKIPELKQNESDTPDVTPDVTPDISNEEITE